MCGFLQIQEEGLYVEPSQAFATLSAHRMDCPTSRQQGAVALNGELFDPWEAKGVISMQGGLCSPIKILPF